MHRHKHTKCPDVFIHIDIHAHTHYGGQVPPLGGSPPPAWRSALGLAGSPVPVGHTEGLVELHLERGQRTAYNKNHFCKRYLCDPAHYIHNLRRDFSWRLWIRWGYFDPEWYEGPQN